MKNVFHGCLGITILIIVIINIILFSLSSKWLSLKWDEWFKPQVEDVEHKVFKKTRSYNESKKQDLIKFRLEYLRAKTQEEKDALASTIRMMFAEYDENQFESVELISFLKQIKYGEN